MILVLMGQKNIINILRKCFRGDAGICEQMGMEPSTKVCAFGEPWIGEDLLTGDFYKDTSLPIIGKGESDPWESFGNPSEGKKAPITRRRIAGWSESSIKNMVAEELSTAAA
jgi:hypothetical protein